MGFMSFKAKDRDIAINKNWMDQSAARRDAESEEERMAGEAEALAQEAIAEAEAAAEVVEEKKVEAPRGKPTKKSSTKKAASGPKEKASTKNEGPDLPPGEDPNNEVPYYIRNPSEPGGSDEFTDASGRLTEHGQRMWTATDDSISIKNLFNSPHPLTEANRAKWSKSQDSPGFMSQNTVDQAEARLDRAKDNVNPIQGRVQKGAPTGYDDEQSDYDETLSEYNTSQGVIASAVDSGLISRDKVYADGGAEELILVAEAYIDHLNELEASGGRHSVQVPVSPTFARNKRNAARKVIAVASGSSKSVRVGALSKAWTNLHPEESAPPEAVEVRAATSTGTAPTVTSSTRPRLPQPLSFYRNYLDPREFRSNDTPGLPSTAESLPSGPGPSARVASPLPEESPGDWYDNSEAKTIEALEAMGIGDVFDNNYIPIEVRKVGEEWHSASVVEQQLRNTEVGFSSQLSQEMIDEGLEANPIGSDTTVEGPVVPMESKGEAALAYLNSQGEQLVEGHHTDEVLVERALERIGRDKEALLSSLHRLTVLNASPKDWLKAVAPLFQGN